MSNSEKDNAALAELLRRKGISLTPEQQKTGDIQLTPEQLSRLQRILPSQKGTPKPTPSPAEQLRDGIAGLKKSGHFDALCNTLQSADANKDGYLSYAEFRHAPLDEPAQTMLGDLEKQLTLAHANSKMPEFLLQLGIKTELKKLNAVLSGEGLPKLKIDFLADALKANGRGR